ncbi:MAG: AmmeMemoRadiSam system protein A [Candidatus Azambacteria bacterium]|nr:AmmeMemoRadiSam system protein A [Candidatus Azambacteria bacterium]
MRPLVELAKKTIETYIRDGKIIEPPKDFPKEFLARKAGVFVTITTNYKLPTKNYTLRGCIGTYLPTRENVAEEIIYNAVAAATEDYRFGPIQKEELPYLSYTVYILSEPELVKNIEDPTKSSEKEFRRAGLDPKKYGIIVRAGAKSGLLLPDLEDVDTVEQQIAICCQKGGINASRERILIYRFSVEKFT